MLRRFLLLISAIGIFSACATENNIYIDRTNSHMSLETQLKLLGDLGITPNSNITLDDFLYTWHREDYESKPFELLLFTLGIEAEREPYGRNFFDHAWNFDTEAIYQSGDYIEIIKKLCDVSGQTKCLTDVRDSIDFDAKSGWDEYRFGGSLRKWNLKVNDDWADLEVLYRVTKDIETGDSHFYFIDNGQAMVLYYLTEKTAQKINKLSNGLLLPVVSNP